MTIETVGIVGTGVGGVDLAELAAVAGFEIVALHVEGDDPLALWEALTQRLAWQVSRGTISDAGRETALSRINLASEPETLAPCDLVYVSAPNLAPDARCTLLSDIEQHLAPHAILAMRHNGWCSDKLAPRLLRPCRFLGIDLLHRDATCFVEVVPTERTRASVTEEVERWIVRMGRSPLRISDPGEFPVRAIPSERPSVI